MNDPLMRPATAADCRKLAALYRISSDGVADYVWSRLAEPGEDPLDVGARRYAREDCPFSYRHCSVLTDGDAVVGMLSGFPLHVDAGHVEPDPVLRPYAELEEDASYYICGMALRADYRGRGLGRRLLDHAEARAAMLGYTKTSLICFEENAPAMRLYLGAGYTERKRLPVVPHRLIHCRGDALLLVKPLA